MRIGELARRTGVTTRALRYYEEQNLLTAERSGSGQRHYAEDAVDRIHLIRQLYAAGLSSKTIAELTPCVIDGQATPSSSSAWPRNATTSTGTSRTSPVPGTGSTPSSTAPHPTCTPAPPARGIRPHRLASASCRKRMASSSGHCITAVQGVSVDLRRSAVTMDFAGTVVELEGDGAEVGLAERA